MADDGRTVLDPRLDPDRTTVDLAAGGEIAPNSPWTLLCPARPWPISTGPPMTGFRARRRTATGGTGGVFEVS